MKRLLVGFVGLLFAIIGVILNSSLMTVVRASAAVDQTNAGGGEYQMDKMVANAPYETIGGALLILAVIMTVWGFTGKTDKK